MDAGLVIALAGIAALALFVVVAYNRFVRLRQLVNESWSGIDVELRRRYDLIPNLVETVKGYAAHERQVLRDVVEARARAVANSGAHDSQIADEQRLVGQLRQLLAVAEAYPELKADRQFLALQHQLAQTEDRLAAIRRLHNANVRNWNTLGQTIPWSLIGSMARWSTEPYFEMDPAIGNAPPPGPGQGGWSSTSR